MTTPPSDKTELVLQILRKIQGELSGIKRELRDVKAEVNSLRSIIGDLLKAESRRETSIAALEQRN